MKRTSEAIGDRIRDVQHTATSSRTAKADRRSLRGSPRGNSTKAHAGRKAFAVHTCSSAQASPQLHVVGLYYAESASLSTTTSDPAVASGSGGPRFGKDRVPLVYTKLIHPDHVSNAGIRLRYHLVTRYASSYCAAIGTALRRMRNSGRLRLFPMSGCSTASTRHRSAACFLNVGRRVPERDPRSPDKGVEGGFQSPVIYVGRPLVAHRSSTHTNRKRARRKDHRPQV